MTESNIAAETETVQKGVHAAQFVSRRSLVVRRFLRNEPAVVALILLVGLFVACYALPPLLPYSYTDLDYSALQEPPSANHLFGTNSLGQDLLAQTLRGMQKSMLIGICVAFISATIAAAVGSISGYFGGWRDSVLMFVVDLILSVWSSSWDAAESTYSRIEASSSISRWPSEPIASSTGCSLRR